MNYISYLDYNSNYLDRQQKYEYLFTFSFKYCIINIGSDNDE